ncbi:MAG: exo-alpha-sialidase [Ruminococcaceae bacterium]|nr:exo-alpha-sialidase [Oscillospiraceae bacterium]
MGNNSVPKRNQKGGISMEKYQIARYDTYAREPIIRKTKDGTLICLSLSGGEREPDNQNVVLITKSYDNGRTWSKPEILFSHQKRGCWATELFCDGMRDFAVVHTYNAATWYKELQTFHAFCDESGEHWTEPVTMRGITNCSVRQGITMSNGEILFPVYWQETRSGFAYKSDFDIDGAKYPFVSGVAISADHGETFGRYGYIASDVSLWEPNAVEVEDGHIILYCRTCQGYLCISESFDYGRNWSAGRLSDIPNADTKVTVLKVNGHILMINNFNTFPERNNLCIYKSEDGKTFEKIVNVEEPSARFFYPHAFADEREHVLYVAYENTKEHWLKTYTFEELGV